MIIDVAFVVLFICEIVVLLKYRLNTDKCSNTCEIQVNFVIL